MYCYCAKPFPALGEDWNLTMIELRFLSTVWTRIGAIYHETGCWIGFRRIGPRSLPCMWSYLWFTIVSKQAPWARSAWSSALLAGLEYCFGAWNMFRGTAPGTVSGAPSGPLQLGLENYPEHTLDHYSWVQRTIRTIIRGLTAWNVSHLVNLDYCLLA
jgi:hypothetical protein